MTVGKIFNRIEVEAVDLDKVVVGASIGDPMEASRVSLPLSQEVWPKV